MRVIIADDAALLREGLRRSLQARGVQIVAEATTAEELLRCVAAHIPDAVLVDLRMPPTHTDEGLRAILDIRRRFPAVAALLLSQYDDVATAEQLLDTCQNSAGYLLKERITDTGQLFDALGRIVAGEIVLDPQLVAAVLGRRRTIDPLHSMTQRERDVLSLMAEGRSNTGIAERLFLSPKTVERYVAQIFDKLSLNTDQSSNRRVLAVLALMRTADPRQG
jgi:DNA-binding NarL/FixJ family response regulator